MCIRVQKSETFKVAKKDIMCYKIVYKISNGIYESFITNFEYVIRNLYTNKTPEIQEYNYYRGTLEKSMSEQSNCFNYFSKNLFHSYKNIIIANKEFTKEYKDKHWEIKYMKCIIPKGAYYIENRKWYASSQIKILEEYNNSNINNVNCLVKDDYRE